VWTGGVDWRCGLEGWTGGVDWRGGLEVWTGGVDWRDGTEGMATVAHRNNTAW